MKSSQIGLIANRRISLFTISAVLRPLTTYAFRTNWGWPGKRPELLRNFRSGTQAKPSRFSVLDFKSKSVSETGLYRRNSSEQPAGRQAYAWCTPRARLVKGTFCVDLKGCRKIAGPATNGGWIRTEPCIGRHNIRAQRNRYSPVSTRLTAKSNYVRFKPHPPRSEIDMAQNWTIQRCPQFSGDLIRMSDMRDFPGCTGLSDQRGGLPTMQGVGDQSCQPARIVFPRWGITSDVTPSTPSGGRTPQF